MSQITSINSGGGGGGGPINTLTGDVGGPVPPTAGNININSSNTDFILVTGSPGTSTLTVSLSNQLVAGITTNNDIPTAVSIIPINLTPDEAVQIQSSFVAALADPGPTFYTKVRAGFGRVAARKAGLGAPVLNNPTNTYDGPKDLTFIPQASFQVVGDTVQLFVQGMPATIINWTVVLTFFYV